MKKLYPLYFLGLILLFTACSEDDIIAEEIDKKEETEEPIISETAVIIDNISTSTADIGDLITITGKNFDRTATYVIHFGDIIAVINEILENQITITVPENAITGEITLTYNGKVTKVGIITIEALEVTEQPSYKLYGYKRGSFGQSIVEINDIDGTENTVLTTLDNNYYRDLLYFKYTNEIIGQFSSTMPGISQNDNSLFKLNIETGVTTTVAMESRYEKLITGDFNESYIYGYKRTFDEQSNVETGSIVLIDTEVGKEIETLAIMGSDYYANLIYNHVTNEIIGQYNSGATSTTGPETFYLIKINVETGAVTTTKTTTSYEDLIVAQNGNLYGYKRVSSGQSIVEISLNDGFEIKTLITLDETYYSNLEYNVATNEIIGSYSLQGIPPIPDPDQTPAPTTSQNYLVKISLNNDPLVEVSTGTNFYEDLIISRLF